MTDLSVMSFNVRRHSGDDGADAWPERREKAASVVRLHAPDLVGCQEPFARQLADLARELPAYEWVGVGRLDGGHEGEHVPVGYRIDRFDRLEWGTFWLSETPAEPGSVGWDASYPRPTTWVRLRDRATDRTLTQFNTHFDHRGERAREASARLLVGRVDDVADGPAVLTGDMNATPGSPPYRTLTASLADAKRHATHPHHGPTGTTHGFDGDATDRIDYVFVDGFDVDQHAVLADHWDGRYPSDHFPVLATVRYE